MAERKGELANFQVRKRKLNIWKLAVLVILLLVVIYFVVSAVKIFQTSLVIFKGLMKNEINR